MKKANKISKKTIKEWDKELVAIGKDLARKNIDIYGHLFADFEKYWNKRKKKSK